MGGQDAVGQRGQGTAAGGLHHGGVQGGRANLSLLQSLIQGVLIHDPAAGGVDQNGPGLHLRQTAGVHHVPGLLCKGGVEGDKVRLAEQGVKIHIFAVVGLHKGWQGPSFESRRRAE